MAIDGYPPCCSAANSGLGRRHADVRDDDVGPMNIDCREQFVVGRAPFDQFDLIVKRQERADSLSHQEAVLGEDKA